MPLWRCYYHIIWATKHRQPTITSAIEASLFQIVTRKADDLGVRLIAINAMPDHVHTALSIPPTVLIPDLVKQVKGASSHFLNDAHSQSDPFRWQSGYSVHTVGEGSLDIVIRYIRNQKEHHRQGTLILPLEETQEE